MACPFGFGGGAQEDVSLGDDELEELEELEERRGTGDQAPRKKAAAKETKQDPKAKKEARFDFDKDPVSWFYQNQIKGEEDFQRRKEALREEAKKRLEAIIRSKNRMIDWGSDSEWDDMSIHSSELSELDSDVDSLASLMSCAESWIVDAHYKTPAESFVKYTAMAAMCMAGHSLYQAYVAMDATYKVQGVVTNMWWPAAAFCTAALVALALGLALNAAYRRSKRALLCSQLILLAGHSLSSLLVVLMKYAPTAVDQKLKASACAVYGKDDSGSRLCHMLPSIQAALGKSMASLTWSFGLIALAAIVVLGGGIWYTFELCYVEKKALKHKRRHKRRKHSIPWEKIKIVGPVTNCGGTGGAANAGGKCPLGMGAGAAKKNA